MQNPIDKVKFMLTPAKVKMTQKYQINSTNNNNLKRVLVLKVIKKTSNHFIIVPISKRLKLYNNQSTAYRIS